MQNLSGPNRLRFGMKEGFCTGPMCEEKMIPILGPHNILSQILPRHLPRRARARYGWAARNLEVGISGSLMRGRPLSGSLEHGENDPCPKVTQLSH